LVIALTVVEKLGIVKCSKSNIEHKGVSNLYAVEIYKRNYKN